jgi:hypothetical protein
MSSEHSREVLREIAIETADEGNVPGRPAMVGLLIAMAAAAALALIYMATVAAPSQRAQSEASATTSGAPR